MKLIDHSRRIIVHGLVVGLVVLCTATIAIVNLPKYAVHFGPIQLAVFDGKIAIHNREYAYQGSIIGIASSNSTPTRNLGIDLPGVYFRYLRDPPVTGWWTITVSIWYLLPAEILVVATVYLWGRKRFFKRAGHCRSCGYDLRATLERCPECGRKKD